MTTKTSTAMAVCDPLRPACAIDDAAARVRARFLGFTPDRRMPNPNDLPALNESMVVIHPGIVGSSPGFGRPRHCLPASARNSTPNTILNQSCVVEDVLPAVEEPPATTSTITFTVTSPATQPTANAGPLLRAFGVPSIRMTAMIGMGLSATPIARGSRPPMAWLSMGTGSGPTKWWPMLGTGPAVRGDHPPPGSTLTSVSRRGATHPRRPGPPAT